ncbi:MULTISPECIES: CAP domain-containing protein [unclassified Sphingomonas]|uniref:CAP domain-containing protein n=1 Tax=unclassified Sphingomonas TaxID=196159 RepID=UPI001F5AD5CD|nr:MULTISPECIES: CAP domain-containing protein [unclassified Sphingomonas]
MAVLSAIVLGGCQVAAPERVVEPRVIAGSYPRGEALLKAAMLAGHAAARAEVGAPPLQWDDALAADAAVYADTLVVTGRFRHADQPMGPGREGETLFRGTRGAYSYREMVDLWVAEKKDFVDAVTPDFSRTGRGEDVAHYTQIIWRATTRVGCALRSSREDDYLVCRYSPPGNVIGERVG